MSQIGELTSGQLGAALRKELDREMLNDVSLFGVETGIRRILLNILRRLRRCEEREWELRCETDPGIR